MRIRMAILAVGLLAALVFSSVLPAQTANAPDSAKPQKPGLMSGGIPDLSGIWDPDFHGPEGIRMNSWDSADPFAKHPEQEPMTPWAADKFKTVRPPFGALQTFDNTNDPVQRYCDPPGVPRIYMYPWEISFIQTPKIVYILYEYTKVWRAIYMDRDHPKDPDSSWMGDSVGKYVGDTFVIDTVGFNDKTWLDQTGHPHSDALHVIERFRRADHEKLELTVTIEDPKAYTKTISSVTKPYRLTDAPMGETLCAYSEMKEFQDKVIDRTQTPPGK
jgi:hypothetical protein